MIKKWSKYISFTIICLLLISLSGCITPKDSPSLPTRGFFMGILPTPGRGQTIEDAYSQAAEHAEFAPVWAYGIGASGFWNYGNKLIGWQGKTLLKKLIRGNGMFPIIHFSFMDKGENGELILQAPKWMEDATLSSSNWRNLYKTSVLEVVIISKPLYLSTGNEVNRWYEQYGVDDSNPNGFQHFVSLHEELYDLIKKISPETKVFCTFAREIVSENREADLEVLRLFNPNKIDLLVFTSYPYAVQGINNLSDIPDDYYSKAADYMPGKPFGFSEIAWPSLEAFGGEQAQADFIIQATGRLTKDNGINLHLFGWPWLHDLDENDTIGLIKIDGTEKLAYTTWKNISGK